MPPQALALAFAASIYPPAVAAVIALGRGPQLRSRVFAFVFAAYATTYVSGTIMLLLLEELGATSTSSRTASAGLDLALGVLLIGLAVRLQMKRPDGTSHPSDPSKPSKIDRYLESRRLAFVLGITLYVIPSPIYVGAVKAIADAKLSTTSELLDLAVTVGGDAVADRAADAHAPDRSRACRACSGSDQPVVRAQRTEGRGHCVRGGGRLSRRQGPCRPARIARPVAAHRPIIRPALRWPPTGRSPCGDRRIQRMTPLADRPRSRRPSRRRAQDPPPAVPGCVPSGLSCSRPGRAA